MKQPKLRQWQADAIGRYESTRPQDFLVVATPGAGKTSFALTLAERLLSSRTVRRVVVVCPTEHLKFQWAQAATAFGIALDHTYGISQGGLARQFDGYVVTYAGVAMRPWAFRATTDAFPTLVIFDELHHAGDSRSWGEALREAFDSATRRVSLTGTPFRSDDNPIPFVRYEADSEGPRSQSDFDYGYAQALADDVVRPVIFYAYSGTMRWQTRAGVELSAQLTDEMTKDVRAHAWRTALDPGGQWISHVMRAAHRRLTQIRSTTPDAGGLVIAGDQKTARAYAKLLGTHIGHKPKVALSDDPKADKIIAEFAESDEPWLVAVRMVSEGVDIPRLQVGVYATPASTPLFFAQVVGRFVRRRKSDREPAAIFLPSVPVLLSHAAQIEQARDHVLGRRRDDEWAEWDEPDAGDPGERDDEPAFTPIDSEATLDRVVVDGDAYLADNEEDFFLSPPAAGSGPIAPVAVLASQVKSVRAELNTCVRAYADQSASTPARVHADLRRATSGPPVAQADLRDLERRLDLVRRWAVGRR